MNQYKELWMEDQNGNLLKMSIQQILILDGNKTIEDINMID